MMRLNVIFRVLQPGFCRPNHCQRGKLATRTCFRVPKLQDKQLFHENKYGSIRLQLPHIQRVAH